jgi:hypothetical protein
MNDVGAASEDEVILAWLQAEVESPRFQRNIIGNPPNREVLRIARMLAHQPDLNNPHQNATRREILRQTRGFGAGTLLFTGLANDLTWRRFRATPAEIDSFLYANHPTWTTLAPSRRISEGAANVDSVPTLENVNEHIRAVAQRIHDDPGLVLPQLIALRRADSDIVVMEGHTRATAYVIEAANMTGEIDAFLGAGASVATWQYR